MKDGLRWCDISTNIPRNVVRVDDIMKSLKHSKDVGDGPRKLKVGERDEGIKTHARIICSEIDLFHGQLNLQVVFICPDFCLRDNSATRKRLKT